MVKITQERYDELVENERWVECLETAGVDNWEGYDYACDLFRENI